MQRGWTHGELWTVPSAGGVAQRLTSDPGDVIAPHYSPDGRWIAFTWRRAKGRDIYVLPAGGGEPRRLTFDASGQAEDGLVVGWTPDSARIVFQVTRFSNFDVDFPSLGDARRLFRRNPCQFES